MRIKRFKLFIGAAAIIILVASVLLGISGCGESGINVTTMKDKETNEEELVKSSEGQDSEEDDGSKGQVKKPEETESSEEQDKKSEESEKNSTICVYICGAVVNEGVYEVPTGSRVSDVLDKAGGYSEEALHGYVNLARTLEDGERVYIPDKQELESLGILEGDGSSGGSGDSSGVSADGSSGSSADGSNETLVNINTADSETLQTLPGIGEKKAADIIAYREEHGAFSSTEDLKNISGIGDSTFEKLSPHITVN